MNNFGPRTAINLFSGVGCCLLWLAIASSGKPLPNEVTPHAFAIWAIGLIYLASYRFPSLRAALQLPKTLTIASAAMIVLMPVILSSYGDDAFGALFAKAYVPVALLVGPLLIVSLRNHAYRSKFWRENFRFGTGDSSQFATRRDFHPMAFKFPTWENGRLGWSDHIYLGRTRFRHDFRPRHIGMPINCHMANLGMSNSGKAATQTFTILGTLGASALVVDVKGEYTRCTHRRRSELGPVHVVDPFGITGKKPSQYNPLHGVDPRTQAGLERIAAITGAIVEREADGRTKHFDDNAITVIEGVMTYVCAAMPEKMRNLVTVYRLLQSKHPQSDGYQAGVFDTMVGEMAKVPFGQCAAAARLLSTTGDNEKGGFLSTISRNFKWLASPKMQHLFSGHDFDFSELATLGDEKPTIFVALGIDKHERYHRFLRLMVALSIADVRKCYAATGETPKNGIFYSLDEYALYAKGLEQISTGFGNLRQMKICLAVQAQNKAQIEAAIGEKETQLLLQSSTVTVFGVNNDNQDVAHWCHKQLGDHLVRKKYGLGMFADVTNEYVAPLMTVRAINDALPQQGRGQFIFPVNDCPPIWCDRLQYKPFLIRGKQVWEPLDLGPIYDDHEPQGNKPCPIPPEYPRSQVQHLMRVWANKAKVKLATAFARLSTQT